MRRVLLATLLQKVVDLDFTFNSVGFCYDFVVALIVGNFFMKF